MKKVSKYIIELAKKNNIVHNEDNDLDKMANKITELAGDNIKKDPILDLIIELKRRGIISKEEVVKFSYNHLNEMKNNNLN